MTTLLGLAPATWWVVVSLYRHRVGVDAISVLSLAGTLLVGEPAAGAVITLMLATGRALEAFAAGRARRELTTLVAHVPTTTHRREGDEIVDIPVDVVEPADLLVITPAEVVPVDGVLRGDAGTAASSGSFALSPVPDGGTPAEWRRRCPAERSTKRPAPRDLIGGQGDEPTWFLGTPSREGQGRGTLHVVCLGEVVRHADHPHTPLRLGRVVDAVGLERHDVAVGAPVECGAHTCGDDDPVVVEDEAHWEDGRECAHGQRNPAASGGGEQVEAGLPVEHQQTRPIEIEARRFHQATYRLHAVSRGLTQSSHEVVAAAPISTCARRSAPSTLLEGRPRHGDCSSPVAVPST